jgi:hypothetical protein
MLGREMIWQKDKQDDVHPDIYAKNTSNFCNVQGKDTKPVMLKTTMTMSIGDRKANCYWSTKIFSSDQLLQFGAEVTVSVSIISDSCALLWHERALKFCNKVFVRYTLFGSTAWTINFMFWWYKQHMYNIYAILVPCSDNIPLV